MGRRWPWLILIILLVAAGVGAGWLFYGYEALPPEPVVEEEGGLAPVTKFQVTMAVPSTSAQPEAYPITTTARTVATSVSGSISEEAMPEPAVVSGKVASPEDFAEETLKPEAVPAIAPEEPMASLRQPVRVQGLLIPPPEAVPPSYKGEKPILILETERQGKIITVRGTTNLAVEGNGVQVSLFRVYRERKGEEQKRASLDSRGLALWFEGRFPVEDKPWFKAWAEQAKDYPSLFGGMDFLDKERVFVEVLFTANKAEVGPVPGLNVYPIPRSNMQVYRIVRPIKLPLDREVEVILAKAEGIEPPELPAAPPAVEEPRYKPAKSGWTGVTITPLNWLDGPRSQT